MPQTEYSKHLPQSFTRNHVLHPLLLQHNYFKGDFSFPYNNNVELWRQGPINVDKHLKCRVKAVRVKSTIVWNYQLKFRRERQQIALKGISERPYLTYC